MSASGSSVEEQAIAWTIRARDPDFDDWDALTDWLEENYVHSEAFQKLALLDEMLPALMPAVHKPKLGHTVSKPWRWSNAGMGATAAAFVTVVSVSISLTQPSYYAVETQSGEQRTIATEDGSKIALNGDTQITLSEDNPRFAILERGEALFTVVHKDHDPFIVKVGDAVIRDAGTIFNVVRTGGVAEVVVAQGQVIFNPDVENVVLPPGYGLRVAQGRRELERFSMPTAAVGGWKRNQLIYTDVSITRIAADVSRSLGEKVTVAPNAKSTRFTGTINLTKNADKFFDDAAPMLGVSAYRTKSGWILARTDEATR